MKVIINTVFVILLISFYYTSYSQTPECNSPTIPYPSDCERFPYPFQITMPDCNSNPYRLVFEENFNGNSLDFTNWELQSWGQGSLVGGNSYQIYTIEPDNIDVSNGTLKIKANNQLKTRRAINYLPDNQILSDGLPNSRTYQYSSSNIWTYDSFHYGKYEIRCKISRGKGLWPAFWTYSGDARPSGPYWNELDIFEMYYDKQYNNNFSYTNNIHFDLNNDGGTCREQCVYSEVGSDFENWHTYTCYFEEDKIDFYIDGNFINRKTRYVTTNLQPLYCGNGTIGANSAWEINGWPRQPGRMILNMAIETGNAPNASTFPGVFEIDWVRFYSNQSCPTPGVVDLTLPCHNGLSQNGFYINDKLDLITEVCPQNDIIIKAIPLNSSECSNGYFLLSSNKQLFISVTLCNDNLVPIDVEYSKWIEPGSATSFNLLANYSVFGVTVYPNLPSPYITFNPGQTYRIKVATSRCGWQQYTKFIHIASDVRNIDGSNIVSDVYGKYITISNSTVTQPKEIVAREYIKILPNSTLYAGTYKINDFGCADMAGREMDSTNEEVLRMNYMVDENVLYNEEFTNVELNKETIAETKPSNSNFTIYPNPNKGKFIIELTNKTTESTLEIYDLMGKKVWSKVSSENKLKIDISSQPKGIYLVKMVSENQVIVQKIVYD